MYTSQEGRNWGAREIRRLVIMFEKVANSSSWWISSRRHHKFPICYIKLVVANWFELNYAFGHVPWIHEALEIKTTCFYHELIEQVITLNLITLTWEKRRQQKTKETRGRGKLKLRVSIYYILPHFELLQKESSTKYFSQKEFETEHTQEMTPILRYPNPLGEQLDGKTS